MDEARLFEQLAPLGVGGLLGWGMFLLYRKDAKENAEKWAGTTALLVATIKENSALVATLIEMQRSKK